MKSAENTSAHLLVSGASDQKVFSVAIDSLARSSALRAGAHKYTVEHKGVVHELHGGAAFSRSLRHVTAMDTLRDESLQMRPVRDKEEHCHDHFESLCSDVGGWSWTGGSVMTNSLDLRGRHSRGTPHSPSALAPLHHTPLPTLSTSVMGRHRHTELVLKHSEGPLTEGDGLASIRKAMETITVSAAKNASLFALTEVGPSHALRDSTYGTSKDDSAKKPSRQMQLLRESDALVEEAIRYMERTRAQQQETPLR